MTDINATADPGFRTKRRSILQVGGGINLPDGTREIVDQTSSFSQLGILVVPVIIPFLETIDYKEPDFIKIYQHLLPGGEAFELL